MSCFLFCSSYSNLSKFVLPPPPPTTLGQNCHSDRILHCVLQSALGIQLDGFPFLTVVGYFCQPLATGDGATSPSVLTFPDPPWGPHRHWTSRDTGVFSFPRRKRCLRVSLCLSYYLKIEVWLLRPKNPACPYQDGGPRNTIHLLVSEPHVCIFLLLVIPLFCALVFTESWLLTSRNYSLRGVWVAQWVGRLTPDFGSGHDLTVLGAVLSGVSAWEALTPSASPLSLKYINK